MADATDSKSVDSNIVLVQVQSPAPQAVRKRWENAFGFFNGRTPIIPEGEFFEHSLMDVSKKPPVLGLVLFFQKLKRGYIFILHSHSVLFGGVLDARKVHIMMKIA